jgi:hypothetical protein
MTNIDTQETDYSVYSNVYLLFMAKWFFTTFYYYSDKTIIFWKRGLCNVSSMCYVSLMWNHIYFTMSINVKGKVVLSKSVPRNNINIHLRWFSCKLSFQLFILFHYCLLNIWNKKSWYLRFKLLMLKIVYYLNETLQTKLYCEILNK